MGDELDEECDEELDECAEDEDERRDCFGESLRETTATAPAANLGEIGAKEVIVDEVDVVSSFSFWLLETTAAAAVSSSSSSSQHFGTA